MKRVLFLGALAMAGTAAQAQTNVTMYGIVDVGVNRVTGLAQGTSDALVSGIMEGSRLGVKGTEDLGGGFRAVFTAEHRLEADVGGNSVRPPSGSQLPDRVVDASLLGLPVALQPAVTAVAYGTDGKGGIGATVGTNLGNAFWDRQVYVGLVTPIGAIVAGRMYTPAYEINAAFDTLGTQSSLSAGQVASLPASIDIRRSNAIQYRVERSGITANVMVSAGENSATTGKMWGLMAKYEGDAFGIGAGYNARENELGDSSLRTFTTGAWVALGPGRLHGLFGIAKDDHPAGLSTIAAGLTPVVGPTVGQLVQDAFAEAFKQDSRLFQIGYKLLLGTSTVYFAYNSLDDRRPANADTSSFGIVYTYALSKRTDINAVATHFNNKNLAQAAPGQAGFLGGVTARAGEDSNNLALGIRHRF